MIFVLIGLACMVVGMIVAWFGVWLSDRHLDKMLNIGKKDGR